MAYLVHHTLNRNGTYTGGKRTYQFMDKVLRINRSTNRSQRLTDQHFFPIKTNGKKCDFDCPIHWIFNSGKIEGVIFQDMNGIYPYLNIV